MDIESSARRLNEAFDQLSHSRDQFSLMACQHLLAVVEACKTSTIDRSQLTYLFEYVKTFSFALTDELKETVHLGASLKVQDDSYFRALEKNLRLIKDQLSAAPRR